MAWGQLSACTFSFIQKDDQTLAEADKPVRVRAREVKL